jgi:hypothetical protein
MNRKTYSLIGAAIGLAAFLALGLLPALLYGGYAGLLLAGALLGSPVQASAMVRALVVAGMVFGVLGVGGLFTAAGGAVGAAVAALTGVPPARRPVRTHS